MVETIRSLFFRQAITSSHLVGIITYCLFHHMVFFSKFRLTGRSLPVGVQWGSGIGLEGVCLGSSGGLESCSLFMRPPG